MSFFIALFAPIWGGLIYGVERKLKARMQRRVGPPLLQPFYDMAKLFAKERFFVNTPHALFAIFYFLTLWVAVFMLFLGSNLLLVVFTHLLASVFYVLAGFSVRSIFSNLGANRKLLSIVAYEPVLLLFAVLVAWQGGEFSWSLVIGYMALLIVAPAILKLSPFDAPKAHQEIVGGVEVEFGGALYEALYAAKFLEMIFLYTLIYIVGGLGLVVVSFGVIHLIDNATVRVRIDALVTLIYKYAFTLIILALLWRLYEVV